MTTKDTTPVLVAATRTPIGKFLGGLSPLSAPELGAIAIRDAVLAEHPWVARELLRAFQASKERHLHGRTAAAPVIPEDRRRLDIQEMIGGGDPLPFGLEANRPTLEALIDYAHRQQIIPAPIAPEEMFAPGALEP